MGNKSTVPVTFISEANGLWNTRSEATSHDFPFVVCSTLKTLTVFELLVAFKTKGGNGKKKVNLEISTYILWTCGKIKNIKILSKYL